MSAKEGKRPSREGPNPEVRPPPRGVVAFDMDGTLLDDMPQIGATAAQVMHEAFGTSLHEAEQMYFRTTGKPFELQLRELYPEATPFELIDVPRKFHEAKVEQAYKQARIFPEVAKMLKRLDQAGWVLAISTGAEKEMAEIVLEREGIGFLFEEVRGAAQGTKVQHLREFRKKWPRSPLVLVGDSRFDMQAARTVKGVTALGRACLLRSWAVAPSDLRRWGASWADYTLENVPEVLDELFPPPGSVGPRPKVFTARGPSKNAKVHETGAKTYEGEKLCIVSGCRRQAGWTWQGALFCDRHISDEARSVEFRTLALKESRRAARTSASERAEADADSNS